jgi:hypothetical protein
VVLVNNLQLNRNAQEHLTVRQDNTVIPLEAELVILKLVQATPVQPLELLGMERNPKVV